MSGDMVCMSRPLASRLAADLHFGRFVEVARRRNARGEPCRSPQACAAQPAASHMWHHEDAGIGYNVFRATVAANASTLLVPAAPAGASSVPSGRPPRTARPRARAPAPLGLTTRHRAPRRSY
eukprot:Transcript_24647.p4 GENE.Transcript_24647~~Transcript_24647.p4  ORF type:complete len:123 (+),score=13.73 Transcript_24647:798-1166(+)